MDRKEFIQLLDGALAHLYDYPRLETHPFAAALPIEERQRSAGWALSRYLTDTIKLLRPADDLSRNSSPWRDYLYLHLRYIHLNSAQEVARKLDISERQSRRVHAEAVDALATALWPKVQATRGNERSAATPVATDQDYPGNGNDLRRLTTTATQRLVDLAVEVDGVLQMLGGMTANRNIAISNEIPAGIPQVAVRRTLLRQGLINLIVGFCEHGACHIRFSARVRSDTMGLCLSASGGPAEGGPAHERPGVRIGALASQLQEDRSFKMGAHLLMAQGASVNVEQESAELVGVHIVFPVTKPRTVLIVDDNPDTVSLFRHYLAAGTYAVVEADSGPLALQVALKQHPDAIVLDIMMPDQDGWETLQVLRNHPRTQDIPVVICSVIDQRELALSLGASDLLPKPVSRQTFLEVLERHLGCRTE